MIDLGTVLLLENEPLIAMDVEAMLLSSGANKVHHAMTCRDAIRWLQSETPDFAILDLKLSDASSSVVAEWLVGGDVPFIVYSGHKRSISSVAPVFAEAVWLDKPCSEAELESAVQQALGLPLR